MLSLLFLFIFNFRLVRMCSQHFGAVAANTVQSYDVDQLPLLLIVSRARSTNEVSTVIHG